MLELSDWEFKTTMISTLKALMGRVDSSQEQMGSVSREVEVLRKSQELLEIKNTVTEMENALEGLVSRLDTAEEGISELKDMSVETSKMEVQVIKKTEKDRISKNCGTGTKGVTYMCHGNTRGEERMELKKQLKQYDREFSQMNYQTPNHISRRL